MNYAGKRVVTTGAGGFIGSHVVEALVRQGATVRAFVRYNGAGSAGWLDQSELRGQFELFSGDVRDRDSVRRGVEGCDVVLHLAALIAIPYSYQAPASYLETNAFGTLNVLQACRDAGVGRVVVASTSEVYGAARTVPMDESHPLRAQSPYAASKIAADQLALSFAASFGTPVVVLRPFNAFGPRQSARAVVGAIVAQALARDRVELGRLDPTRDFTYVEDVADGFVRAGAAPGIEGETIQLGTGREISIRDLAATILAIMGKNLPIVHVEARDRPPASEVERLCSNPAKAKRLLGWAPTVSLEDGLARTIPWMERRLEQYRPESYAT